VRTAITYIVTSKGKKMSKNIERVDEHLGCPSWPNCDLAPLGCSLEMGKDVEWYGHKDPEPAKRKKEDE
jgi:hypothetical protein